MKNETIRRVTGKALELAPLFLTAWLGAAAQSPGTGINLNHATPAAPTGTRNVTFQNDSSTPTRNISAYVTYPTVQVACPGGSDLAAAVNSCLASLPSPTGGICDARACSNNYTWNTATTISGPNEAILLPCGTLTATVTVTVSATVRNSTIHGCAAGNLNERTVVRRRTTVDGFFMDLRLHRDAANLSAGPVATTATPLLDIKYIRYRMRDTTREAVDRNLVPPAINLARRSSDGESASPFPLPSSSI